MRSEAQQRVTLGIVRMVVLAPLVFAFGLPLIMLFHSLVPLYAGIAAGGAMFASGAVETARGLAARRAADRALPEARTIE